MALQGVRKQDMVKLFDYYQEAIAAGMGKGRGVVTLW